MTRRSALSLVCLVLLSGAAPLAGGLEIIGDFQLGNIGFAATRASTDATLPGSDWFWGGFLSVREDLSSNIKIDALLQRDQIAGNTVSALFQYTAEFFRVGMGPYLGLLNSPTAILKSGVTTLVGLEIPGKAFVSLRTDSSVGGQTGAANGYVAENDILRLGFYVGDAAICTLGMTFKQLSATSGTTEVVDSLTDYSFDVKFYEKNVPFRLDFVFAWQVLQRQYIDGASEATHGLGSLIAGAGIDLIFSSTFALTLDFSTSLWSVGSDVLAGQSAAGFAPFLFQASAGFELTLPSSAGPEGTL
jgi:hypothetical protein